MNLKSITSRTYREKITRIGHVCVNYNEQILLWGGYCHSKEMMVQFKDPEKIFIYNPLTKCWSVEICTGSIPHQLFDPTASIIGDRLYVFGVTISPTSLMHCLDLKTLIWTKVDGIKGIAPANSINSVSWQYKCKYYIFGGDGAPSDIDSMVNQLIDRQPDLQFAHYTPGPDILPNNQFVEYDPVENSWNWPKYSGQCPSPRFGHSSALIGDKCYIFGGMDQRKQLDDLYCLDMETKVWSKIEPKMHPSLSEDTSNKPPARLYASFTPISSNTIVLFCGESSAYWSLNDCWLLDVKQEIWMKCCLPILTGRSHHQSVQSSHGELTIIGGESSSIDIDEYTKNVSCDELLTLQISPKTLVGLSLDTFSMSYHDNTYINISTNSSTLNFDLSFYCQDICFTYSNSIFLCASDKGGSTTKFLRKYDPLSRYWTTLSELKSNLTLTGGTGSVIGDRLYVFLPKHDWSMYYLDMKTLTWSKVKQIPPLKQMPSSFLPSWTYKSKFFIFYKSEDDQHNRILEYDPVRGRYNWPEYSGQPPNVTDAAGALMGRKYYVFGGLDCASLRPSNDLYSLDMETRTWTKIRKRIPLRRQQQFISTTTHSSSCLISDIGNDIEVDSSTNLIPQRRIHTSFTPLSDDTIILYGGLDSYRNTVLNDCWLFNINQETWTKVPLPSNCEPRHRHTSFECPNARSEITIIGGYRALDHNHNPRQFCEKLVTLSVDRASLGGLAHVNHVSSNLQTHNDKVPPRIMSLVESRLNY